jgi:hypothetical protein
MDTERGGKVPEEDDGAGIDAAAEAASCVVRRFVIDPGRNVVRDGSGQTVAFLMGAGGEAIEAGSAGARLVLGIGRKLIGSETSGASPDEDTGR